MKLRWPIVILALVLAACGRPDKSPHDPPVVLLGIDGGEWQVIDEMIAAGDLPNFAKVRREGAWGHLINNGMEISPPVWTTFATGYFARQHGILDHVFPYGGEGARRPVTSELRQVPALWNVADHYGLRSIVVGYFVSHPPEPIDGVVVSSLAPTWQAGTIHPEGALPLDTERYLQLPDADYRRTLIDPYFGWDYEEAQADDPDSPYRVAAATVRERYLDHRIERDEFLRRAAEDLAFEPSDLFITYYRIPDFMSHSLWKYYEPDAFENPPSEEELKWFGESVKESYRFVDRALGDLLRIWDGQANIIIVSDHGFGRASRTKMEDPDAAVKYLSGDHRPDGILMATGPDIQPGQVEGLTVMEIAPTIAAMLGLPVAGDLPGRVALELLRPGFFDENPIQSVADYSHVPQANREVAFDEAAQAEEMDALKGLGYVGEGVEFDALNQSEEFDFWTANDRLVAGHMASEIFYYLHQGDLGLAEQALELVEQNRPDLVRRTLAFTSHKFDQLLERLPEGVMNPEPFEAFIEAHPRKSLKADRP